MTAEDKPRWRPNERVAGILVKFLKPQVESSLAGLLDPDNLRALDGFFPRKPIFSPGQTQETHPIVMAITAYQKGAMSAEALVAVLTPYADRLEELHKTATGVQAVGSPTLDTKKIEDLIMLFRGVTGRDENDLSQLEKLEIVRAVLPHTNPDAPIHLYTGP